TRERREGSYTSVFSWFNKFATSLAYGLSGPIVVLAGFNVDVHREAGVPDDILWNMRLLLAILPLVLVGFALYFSRHYKITREDIAETKRLLEERRGEISSES
ncbi:MAG: MFS transporter, partial [Puniceicoccaceae bacterium]